VKDDLLDFGPMPSEFNQLQSSYQPDILDECSDGFEEDESS
jgi:hypothetical protein